MSNEMTDLNEDELTVISGGSSTRRERTLTVRLVLPSGNEAIEITVYIDGEYEPSMTATLDPFVEIKNFSFKGSDGKETVEFKINNLSYARYQLDFDKLEVVKL